MDDKISCFEGITDSPILILAINKFNKYLFRSEKYKIHCGVILWAFMHEEKVSSHFDTGVLYMLHEVHASFGRTMATIDESPYDSSIRCRKLFKLFLLHDNMIWCVIIP